MPQTRTVGYSPDAEWLEADGLGGFASGTVGGRADAPLPRAAAGRHHAADRAHGAGQRHRGVGRDERRPLRPLVAALRARRHLPRRRRRASRPSAPEPWPAWTFALRGRHRGRRRRSSRSTGRPEVVLALAARRAAHGPARAGGAAAALGPRLPRACTTRTGASGFDAETAPGPGHLAALRRRAGRDRARQRRVPPRARPGTAASSTTRSGRAGSTRSRTWRRRATFAFDLAARDAVAGPARRRAGRAARSRASRWLAAALTAEARAPRRLRLAAAPRGRRLRRARAARAGRSSPAIPWFTDWGRDTFIALRGLLPGHRPARRRARHPAGVGRRGVARACCRTASPIRRARPSTTRSTRRSGTWSRRTIPAAARRRACASTTTARACCERAIAAILDGYAAGTRYGIRADARRPARGRRARRAAHLDGREGRRLGGDAAHRQAGRDPGAVAQRARDRRRGTARWLRPPRRRARRRLRRRGSGTRTRGCCYDVVDVDHVPGPRRPDLPAEPDPRRRRPAASRSSTASARAGSSTRSSASW